MQITPQQKQQLKSKVITEMTKNHLDYMTIDLDSEIDSTLTWNENYSHLMELVEQQLNPIPTGRELREEAMSIKAQLQTEQNTVQEDNKIKWLSNLVHKSVVCAITGSRGSGKSALAFHYLEIHHKLNPTRPCCVYKFPQPSLLPHWIQNIEDMNDVPNNAVMLMDEAAIEFNQYSFQSKNTQGLSNFIKIARHKGVSLFIVTQNCAMLTRDVRRLIDFYLLRQPSNSQLYDEISIIKRWYQNCFMLFSTETQKKKGYYVADWNLAEFMTFDLPTWWTEDISKAYSGATDQISNSSTLLLKIGNIELYKNRSCDAGSSKAAKTEGFKYSL